MKLKYEFAVREIMDDYILVPMGEAALAFSSMITTSEVGAFLCGQLRKDVTREELLAKVLEEYDVDSQTAQADLDEFLGQLRQMELLED